MAKVTWTDCGPDHPIYKEGLSTFVPAPRPSTDDSPTSTDGTSPAPQPDSPGLATPGRVVTLEELVQMAHDEMIESVPHQFGKTAKSSSSTTRKPPEETN